MAVCEEIGIGRRQEVGCATEGVYVHRDIRRVRRSGAAGKKERGRTRGRERCREDVLRAAEEHRRRWGVRILGGLYAHD
jgi:hypothetical protein